MKRYLSLVLVVVLSALALGACTSDDKPDARVPPGMLTPDAGPPDAKPPADAAGSVG